MTKIKAINNDADLDAALERIGELLRCPEDSPEEEELLFLSDLVEAYEHIHYPIPEPTPAGVVQGRLDALGLSEDALVPIVGNREAVDKVLEGRMAITRDMADGMSKLLGIDVESLLEEPVPREN